ncbi:MAG: WYL domain-containing protein [Clostridia bacterium]|nr:WYL domain-containing protein [Clostridia bacterium]
MAYSERIKNFGRIRDYMRDFYVYGFKSREDYTLKSARSYDDERRHLESWLGDYMRFRQGKDGKTVFLSIDSRRVPHNPLYAAWKTRSFTDGDITLHFHLMDLLRPGDAPKTLREILDGIDARLSAFHSPRTFDESTVRKKLKEYAEEGIVEIQKDGKTVTYRCAGDDTVPVSRDVLDFFSETAPCGVIGSFLLDRLPRQVSVFSFKHHYITGTMDSEILCSLLQAMHDRRYVTVTRRSRNSGRETRHLLVPLRVMISVQSGRQYLMAYSEDACRIRSFRIDGIISVLAGEICGQFDELRTRLRAMEPHLFGVSTGSRGGEALQHVDFTVRYRPEEEYIYQRLLRERRCGTVERLSDTESRFSADVYDASELVPWMRTFLCRLVEYHFSDKALEAQFREDLETMYRMYGVGEASPS